MPDPVLNKVRHVWFRNLSAKLQLFEDRGVAIEICALQVVEQLTAASCHCDEAAA